VLDFQLFLNVQAVSYLSAGICIGFGAIGAAVGEGYAAGLANRALSAAPDQAGGILKTMLVGQAIAESAGIFSLVVAMLLIFIKFPASGAIGAAAILGAGLSMGLSAVGSGIGSGFPAGKACQAIGARPDMSGPVTTNMLIGSAICQTPTIFGLLVAFMLMFLDFGGKPEPVSWAALLGAGLAMGLSAIGSGLGAGLPAGAACQGIAARPEHSGLVTTNMLIGSAICQTPTIFGLVVAFMLMFVNLGGHDDPATMAALLGAGLAMGFSAIGSGVGAGMPAEACCEGIAEQPQVSTQLTTNMLIGSAVCQTPAIFGMVIAFLLMFIDFSSRPTHPTVAALLGAGLSVGLACIGPGIGNGLTARDANLGIARQPQSYSRVTMTMLVGMSVAQSTAIYGFLISLILIFRIFEPSNTLTASAALLGAGVAMGFGGFGPGVGEGITGGYAVKWVARSIDQSVLLTRTMLVGQAVAESTGIYSLIVALLLTLTV